MLSHPRQLQDGGEEAAAHYKEALTFLPNTPVLAEISELCHSRSEHELVSMEVICFRHLNEALGGRHAPVLYMLGNALHSDSQLLAAAEAYTQALARLPHPALKVETVLCNLAGVHVHMGTEEGRLVSVGLYQRCLEANPKHLMCTNNLVSILVSLNRSMEAGALLREAYRQQPQHEQVLGALASWHLSQVMHSCVYLNSNTPEHTHTQAMHLECYPPPSPPSSPPSVALELLVLVMCHI